MTEITKIIFDTDIGGDCDDAGALALLHRLCDKKEAELLAVTHCFSSPYFAGCIDAINRFHKRQVPVGINYDIEFSGRSVYAGELCDNYENSYPAKNYKTPLSAPDTLSVLRETLANAKDKSVTLVVTGALSSMAKLLKSGADRYSPLSGAELIKKKIVRTVVMGGRFFESWPMPILVDGNLNNPPLLSECNIKVYGDDSRLVCDRWPGELVFSSFEIGGFITTMVGYPERAHKDDPVARAYMVHNGGKGRSSWDHTAILEAIRPGKYWSYHSYGKISVDESCITHWHHDDTCRHTYLLPKADYEEIRRIIDDIVDGK